MRQFPPLPDDQALKAFLEDCPSAPKLRDIAKAFGVAPQQRAALRSKIRALATEQSVASSLTKPTHSDKKNTSKVPAVCLLQISSINSDGYGWARTADAPETNGPQIVVLPSTKRNRTFKAGDRILARLSTNSDRQIQAEVMRILPKTQSRIFGRAVNTGNKARPCWMLEPAEKGGKRNVPIKQPTGNNPARLAFCENDLLEVELIKDGRSSLMAQPVRNLGSADEPGAFAALAMAEFGLRQTFTKEMIQAADTAQLPRLGQRIDLRNLPLVTIDGEDAKDFDDAVFAEPSEQDSWRLIVAIADVSAYVKNNDVLDTEARLRGNSIYLPGTVIPMLPEALSNGLCSLRPHEDRACLAVEIFINNSGHKLKHKFFQAMIKSSARLTYTTVQSVIEGRCEESDCSVPPGTIHHLIKAFRSLQTARIKRGTLNLNLSEARISFDEAGQPVGVIQHGQQDAHQLIEEFMILANICAAETLEQTRQACVYRVHDQPDPKKIESLRELTHALSLPFAKGQVITPHRFNELLEKVKNTDAEAAVNEAILRCQARAVYAQDNIGHYGLGLSRYAHFTSPIRRYADLLVHRSLVHSMEKSNSKPEPGNKPEDRKQLAEICTGLSQNEQVATKAERRTTARLAAQIIARKSPKELDVTITGLTKSGLFVKLDDGASEGFVPRKTLPDDFYETVAGDMMLSGRHHGWLFKLGDKLTCRIDKISPASGDITLSWLHGGTQQPHTTQKRKKSKSTGRRILSRKRKGRTG